MDSLATMFRMVRFKKRKFQQQHKIQHYVHTFIPYIVVHIYLPD